MAVTIRALEVEDLDALYALENDEKLWCYSDAFHPFSKYVLRRYIANSHKSIYDTKQFRWAVSDNCRVLGFIDLYDFDVRNSRAFVAIAILPEYRGKGYGKQAYKLLEDYCRKHLRLHQLLVDVVSGNKNSELFFLNLGFKYMATMKDWVKIESNFEVVVRYHRLLH